MNAFFCEILNVQNISFHTVQYDHSEDKVFERDFSEARTAGCLQSLMQKQFQTIDFLQRLKSPRDVMNRKKNNTAITMLEDVEMFMYFSCRECGELTRRNGNRRKNQHWKGEGGLHHPQGYLENPPHHNGCKDSPVQLKYPVCPAVWSWRTNKQTFINRRRILMIWPETISNTELWQRTSHAPVEEEIRRTRWGSIGHTLRKPTSSIPTPVGPWPGFPRGIETKEEHVTT